MDIWNCSKITPDHHAWTENDEALFDEVNENDRQIAMYWVKWNMWPRKTFNPYRSSYGLKHILEEDTGIYLTNNQFKDLMLQCGYHALNPNALNWCFNVSLSKGTKLRENGEYPKYLYRTE